MCGGGIARSLNGDSLKSSLKKTQNSCIIFSLVLSSLAPLNIFRSTHLARTLLKKTRNTTCLWDNCFINLKLGDWGPCMELELLEPGRASDGGGDLYALGGPFSMSGGRTPRCGKGRIRPGSGPGASISRNRSSSTNLKCVKEQYLVFAAFAAFENRWFTPPPHGQCNPMDVTPPPPVLFCPRLCTAWPCMYFMEAASL